MDHNGGIAESNKTRTDLVLLALLAVAICVIPGCNVLPSCRAKPWSGRDTVDGSIASVDSNEFLQLNASKSLIQGESALEQGGVVLASTNVTALSSNPDRSTEISSQKKLLYQPSSSKTETIQASVVAAIPLIEAESSSRKLTLDEIINTTLVNDPVLRSGLEDINQANAAALTASLKPNPGLGISQTLMPLTRPFTADRQGGPPQFDIGVNYPIDWYLFGKRAAAMLTSNNGVRVSQSEYANLVRLRVLEASLAYYDLQEAKGLVDVSKQDRDNLKKVEDLIAEAVELGGRGSLELDRIRLDRLRAEQELRIAENAMICAKASLRSLMGFGDNDLAFEVNDAPEVAALVTVLPHEQAFELAGQQRPDLQALRWKVAMANSNRLLQYRNAFPSVAPQIGYTRQFQQKAIGFPDANSFGFGLNMTLPIHDKNQGNRRRATSEYVQRSLDVTAANVALRSQLIQAESELKYLAENITVIQKEQIQVAEKVRNSINSAFAAGGRPLIDVLDAQRTYRETYRRFIETRAAYGRAVERYEAMLGRRIGP